MLSLSFFFFPDPDCCCVRDAPGEQGAAGWGGVCSPLGRGQRVQAQAVVAMLGRRRFRRERVAPWELGTVRADMAGFKDALGAEEGEARPVGSLEAGDT